MFFQLKKECAEALDKAEAIMAKAEAAKREMTAEEKQVFDERMAEVNRLTARIKPIEDKNTLRQFDPVALLSGRLIKPGEATQPPATPRVITIREAMQYASPQEVEQIKSFARYIVTTGNAVISPVSVGHLRHTLRTARFQQAR